jgi:hypothetical protein
LRELHGEFLEECRGSTGAEGLFGREPLGPGRVSLEWIVGAGFEPDPERLERSPGWDAADEDERGVERHLEAALGGLDLERSPPDPTDMRPKLHGDPAGLPEPLELADVPRLPT